MGMFDSVFADCPNCGHGVEYQTKRGECILGEYELDDAPPDVLRGVTCAESKCLGCNRMIKLHRTGTRVQHVLVPALKAVLAEEEAV